MPHSNKNSSIQYVHLVMCYLQILQNTHTHTHTPPSGSSLPSRPPPLPRIPLGHGFFPLLHGVLAPGGQHGARKRHHKGARGGDAAQLLEASPPPGACLLRLVTPGGRQGGGLGAPLQTVTAQDTSAEPAYTLEGSALASPRAGERVAAGTRRVLQGPSLVPETEGRPPGLQGLVSGER